MGAGVSAEAEAESSSLKKGWASQNNTLEGAWHFLIKERVQCLCEGGSRCFRETPSSQKGENAIAGLHSSWVAGSVLAMARPWQQNVQQFQLVEAFQKNNIGMILNLQEVGEHSHCGPGNLPQSGFTYDPETFMAGGVGFYNFSWQDMGVPSLDRMMDIVQVMDHVTRVEGRCIAVHCHAGLGRTGLAIACFLVLATGIAPDKAVKAVRRDRPGALQTARQEKFVHVFEQYLAHLRCILPTMARLDANSNGVKGSASPLTPSRTSTPTDGLESVGKSSSDPSFSRAGNEHSVSDGGAGLNGALGAKNAKGEKGISRNLSTVSSRSEGGAALKDNIMPWTDDFLIRPDRLSKPFNPTPPRTYQEALSRQNRVMHGIQRRLLKNIHHLILETCLATIAIARSHAPGPSKDPPELSKNSPGISKSPLETPKDSPSHRPAKIPPLVHPALAKVAGTETREPNSVPETPVSWAPPNPSSIPRNLSAVQLKPCSFAEAFAIVTRALLPAEFGASVKELERLKAEPKGESIVGTEPAQLPERLAALSALINNGDWQSSPLAAEPLIVVLALLHVFLTGFSEPVLSEASLQQLATLLPEVLAAASSTGEMVDEQKAQSVSSVLQSVPRADLKLLLVISAVLRHTRPGQSSLVDEQAINEIARWFARLLTAQTSSSQAARSDVACSWLTALLENDMLYAASVNLWKEKLDMLHPPQHGTGADGLELVRTATKQLPSPFKETGTGKEPLEPLPPLIPVPNLLPGAIVEALTSALPRSFKEAQVQSSAKK